MADDNINVLLLGDYDYEYPREREICEGLELNGARVHECRFRDEPLFIGVKKLLLLPFYYLLLSVRIWRLSRSVDISAVVLTKFNPLLIPVTWFWSRVLGSIFVYDLFVSLYRTAELRDIHPLLVNIIYYIERVTLFLPNYHLTETEQFADLYAEVYGIRRDRIVPLPVGVDERWFNPREVPSKEDFTVLYWGNFLPHHGVDSIIDAVAELDGEVIEFVLLGEGPEKERIEAEVENRELSSIQFLGRVSMEDLVDWIAAADSCLGIFSSDIRARASITNKVSEGIAMGKPVVTMDSGAIRDWFTDREDIYLVPPEDGSALAAAIRDLRDNPGLRETLGENARKRYEDAFSPENIGRILSESIPLSQESR